MLETSKKLLRYKACNVNVSTDAKQRGAGIGKRVMFAAALCCTGLLLRASTANAQSFNNGGFESPYNAVSDSGTITQTGQIASYWDNNSGWITPKPTLTYSQDTADKRPGTSGSSSQKIVFSSTATSPYFFMHQSFTPVAGKTYLVSIWMKAASSMNVNLLISQDNPYSTKVKKTVTVTGSWQQFKMSYNPNNTARVRFEISPQQTGTLWLDDAVLSNADKVTSATPTTAIPHEYFGMNIVGYKTSQTRYWPNFHFHSTKVWLEWEGTEDTDDVFSFTNESGGHGYGNPEQLIDDAIAKGVEPVISLGGHVPVWQRVNSADPKSPPKSIEEYKEYVNAVLTKFSGKVKYYIPWNEPNLVLSGYNVDDYMKLHKAAHEVIKAKSNSLQVVGPTLAISGDFDFGQTLIWRGADTANNSWGTWKMSDFLEAGGAAYTDVIAYQTYPDPVETGGEFAKELRSLLQLHGVNKPVWVTEGGFTFLYDGPNQQMDIQRAGADLGKVFRAYIVNWATGVSRYYLWYWQGSNAPTDTSSGFETLRSWLMGATMTSYTGPDNNGIYKVEITRPGGYKGYILWKASGSASNYTAPSDVTRRRSDLVNGSVSSISGGSSVSVSTSPVLLENKSANLLSNTSFDAEAYDTQTPSGWSSAQWDSNGNPQTAVADYTESNGGSKSGARHATHYLGTFYRIYTHQVKSVPNGKYTLRAWVKSSGGQTYCQMEAKEYAGSGSKVTKSTTATGKSLTSAISSYEPVEIRDINVTNGVGGANGSITIGFYTQSTGNWFYFDNVELINQ